MSAEKISNTQGALEVSVNLSRKLPQLGIPPENALRLAKEISLRQPTQTPVTVREDAFPWGFFSAVSAFLRGTLDNPSQTQNEEKSQDS